MKYSLQPLAAIKETTLPEGRLWVSENDLETIPRFRKHFRHFEHFGTVANGGFFQPFN